MPRVKDSQPDRETTVLYIRETPVSLARKVRAAAVLAGQEVPGYVRDLLQRHIDELERKGVLPKSKS